MSYQSLNSQQRYVLSNSYGGIDSPLYQWKPEVILGLAAQCVHREPRIYISGEQKVAFEKTLEAARASEVVFSIIFASWNGDGDIVALFGILKDNGKIVLLGEYAIRGALPSYHDRLTKLQEIYRAYWPGRAVLVAMLIIGAYLAAPIFMGISHPKVSPLISPGSFLLSLIFLSISPTGCVRSLWKYLLLRKPPLEPVCAVAQ